MVFDSHQLGLPGFLNNSLRRKLESLVDQEGMVRPAQIISSLDDTDKELVIVSVPYESEEDVVLLEQQLRSSKKHSDKPGIRQSDVTYAHHGVFQVFGLVTPSTSEQFISKVYDIINRAKQFGAHVGLSYHGVFAGTLDLFGYQHSDSDNQDLMKILLGLHVYDCSKPVHINSTTPLSSQDIGKIVNTGFLFNQNLMKEIKLARIQSLKEADYISFAQGMYEVQPIANTIAEGQSRSIKSTLFVVCPADAPYDERSCQLSPSVGKNHK